MKTLRRFTILLLFFGAADVSPVLAEDPSFTELQTNPEAYQGQEIVLGGEVITVREFDGTTQMEIMQLPLGPGHEPQPDQALTQGRFLAFQTGGLRPATVLPHTRVTIVGQIVGSAVADPEHTMVVYPVIEVKSLIIWQVAQPMPAQSPQPTPPPVEILPPPVESTVVFEQHYWTPYWDPAIRVWSWRPFTVYPWWTNPVVVVPPPRLGIVRPYLRPFGPPPKRIVPFSHQLVPHRSAGRRSPKPDTAVTPNSMLPYFISPPASSHRSGGLRSPKPDTAVTPNSMLPYFVSPPASSHRSAGLRSPKPDTAVTPNSMLPYYVSPPVSSHPRPKGAPSDRKGGTSERPAGKSRGESRR